MYKLRPIYEEDKPMEIIPTQNSAINPFEKVYSKYLEHEFNRFIAHSKDMELNNRLYDLEKEGIITIDRDKLQLTPQERLKQKEDDSKSMLIGSIILIGIGLLLLI